MLLLHVWLEELILRGEDEGDAGGAQGTKGEEEWDTWAGRQAFN